MAKLEDLLGIRLFHKGQRGMVLTEDGKQYFLGIRIAFRQIEEATRRLKISNAPPIVTVSCTPAETTLRNEAALFKRWLLREIGADRL